VEVGWYAQPGRLTTLTAEQIESVSDPGLDPLDLCRLAQGLLIAPSDPFGEGLSEQRMGERNLRPATAILARALDLDAEISLDRQ